MSQDVKDLLSECRELIAQRKVTLNQKEDAKRRRLETLDKLEYNIRAMLEEIKELSPNDLHSGPETDHNYPNEVVWIFKKEIKGYLIYIKFKIRQIPIGKDLFVTSFHFDMCW
ncbi:MAG TPA: hypothetical protein VFC58_00060 [Desulfosporosinus sp.]|nr:hypothetical protein [Desulfosporosinus sp.]